jgi:hypothetical protein
MLLTLAVLWSLPALVLFFAWGIGSGNIVQDDSNAPTIARPLVGTILAWSALAVAIPVGVFTFLVLAKMVRYRVHR